MICQLNPRLPIQPPHPTPLSLFLLFPSSLAGLLRYHLLLHFFFSSPRKSNLIKWRSSTQPPLALTSSNLFFKKAKALCTLLVCDTCLCVFKAFASFCLCLCVSKSMEMKPVCVFSFLLLLSGLSSYASQEDAFHHFLLVLQWPHSYCEIKNFSGTPIADFTNHGLWPANATGSTLVFNNKKRRSVRVQENADLSWLYDKNLTLVQNLSTYWPNLNMSSTNEGFWEYQWLRHGSMQGEYPPREYFEKALSLRMQVGDIATALANTSVIPANEGNYSLTQFVDVFNTITNNKKVVLICEDGLLLEVRICVDRDAKTIIDCLPAEMAKKNACNETDIIKLLAGPRSIRVIEVNVRTVESSRKRKSESSHQKRLFPAPSGPFFEYPRFSCLLIFARVLLFLFPFRVFSDLGFSENPFCSSTVSIFSRCWVKISGRRPPCWSKTGMLWEGFRRLWRRNEGSHGALRMDF